uniref:Uncharacterized protein n=1 Tax=Meloidogyne hapla TaxID=6305 RepID=A0A1I8BR48_MELHA
MPHSKKIKEVGVNKETKNHLFYAQDKFSRNEKGVTIKIDLCNKCIDTNCSASDLLTPLKGKKRKADQ